MAGAAIRLDVKDRAVRDGLRRILARVGNLRPALDEIGARLEASTARRFETETDPDGVPWPRSQRAKDEQGQTLTDSGRLRASIARHVGNTEVLVGTNVAYAAIHQFGGTTPPRTIRPRNKKALAWPGARHPVGKVEHPGSEIPKRSFLGVSSRDRDAILRIIERHLRGAVA